MHADPKVLELQSQLKLVEQKLQLVQQGKWVDPRPEYERSPSPEPVYGESGARINTREWRQKEALTKRRTHIITELIKSSPSYRPPADYRPEKKSCRLRIPQDEYPGYNFIGLIIGPRGNTQKRLEKETGARIVIRGRGSVKEGRARPPGARVGADPHDDEDLHVLITADDDASLDKASAMVSKLLRPMDDDTNEWKKTQLRELATINGTLRDDEARALIEARDADAAGGAGDVYRLPEGIRGAAEAQYARDAARVHGVDAAKAEDEYRSFLQELGGEPPPEQMGGPSGPGPRGAGPQRPGLGAAGGPGLGRGAAPPDPRKLYVGYISAHVTDEMLGALFASCGEVLDAAVVRDRATGAPKGFGFVHMATEAGAAAALERLDNYLLGNKRLSVRVKGQPAGGGGPRQRSGGVVGAPCPRPLGPEYPGPQPGADGARPPPPPPPAGGGWGAGGGPRQRLPPSVAAAVEAGEPLPPGEGDDDEGVLAWAAGQQRHHWEMQQRREEDEERRRLLELERQERQLQLHQQHQQQQAQQHDDGGYWMMANGLDAGGEEPPPPGEEEEAAAMADEAAALAAVAAYGGYGGYYGYDGWGRGWDAGAGGAGWDPSYYTPAEYEAAYGAVAPQAPAAAAAAADGGGFGAAPPPPPPPPPSAADGEGKPQGKGRKPRQKRVVQVVALDAQEVERARQAAAEEERRRKAEELKRQEAERMQRMLADRQAAMEASRRQQHEEQQQQQQQEQQEPGGEGGHHAKGAPPQRQQQQQQLQRQPPRPSRSRSPPGRMLRRGSRSRSRSPRPGGRLAAGGPRGGGPFGAQPRRGRSRSPRSVSRSRSRSWSPPYRRGRSPPARGGYSRSPPYRRPPGGRSSRSPAAAQGRRPGPHPPPPGPPKPGERESSPEEGEVELEEGEVALEEGEAAPAGPGPDGGHPDGFDREFDRHGWDREWHRGPPPVSHGGGGRFGGPPRGPPPPGWRGGLPGDRDGGFYDDDYGPGPGHRRRGRGGRGGRSPPRGGRGWGYD